MASKFHISLPHPQTPYNMKPGSRRTPLTPSTITPPSVSAHTPSATRHENGSPTRAEAMLAKVVQQPSNRRDTPLQSPVPSPTQRTAGERQTTARTLSADQWQRMYQQETARYYAAQTKQDGYISFPDFEKYCPDYAASHQDNRRDVAG